MSYFVTLFHAIVKRNDVQNDSPHQHPPPLPQAGQQLLEPMERQHTRCSQAKSLSQDARHCLILVSCFAFIILLLMLNGNFLYRVINIKHQTFMVKCKERNNTVKLIGNSFLLQSNKKLNSDRNYFIAFEMTTICTYLQGWHVSRWVTCYKATDFVT